MVAGGTRGVGVSTLTALMAEESGRRGLRTLVVDGSGSADAGLGRAFGVPVGTPGMSTLREGRVSGPDVVLELTPRLWFIPAGPTDDASGAPGAAYARSASLFGAFDVVFVDAGSALDSIGPAIADSTTGLWAVSGSARGSLAGAYALIKWMARAHPEAYVRPLFNRVSRAGAETLTVGLKEACVRFLGRGFHPPASFPNCPALAPGERIDLAKLDGSASRALEMLANPLVGPTAHVV